MALGNQIVLTVDPRGRFIEYVIGTAGMLPGTIIQVKAATARDAGNRLTCEAYNKSGTGKPGLVGVLDYNKQFGKGVTDAYSLGERGLVYFPLPGDELNCIIADLAGTGATSDFSIGDPLTVQDGTGYLLDAITGTSNYLFAPFELQEAIVDLAANYLAHVMFTGY